MTLAVPWRRLALLSVVAGCSQVFGLDELPGAPPVDASDAAGACSAAPAGTPGLSTTYTLAATTIDVGGAVRFGTGYVAIGTTVTDAGNLTDGVLITIASASDQAAKRLDGTSNDQLWAIAGNDEGSAFAAVGMTRSFLSGASADQGLVVLRNQMAGPSSFRLTDTSGDLAVKPTAVAANGINWLVAGDHANGVFVAGVKDAGSVDSAVLLTASGSPRVRQVVATAAGPVAVGFANNSAFIAAIDLGSGTIRWQRAITGASAFDAAVLDGNLVVVGQFANDGFVITLDPDDGTVQAAELLAGRRIQRVLNSGGRRWLGGIDGDDRVWAATVDGACVYGHDHPGLSARAPVVGPLPLLATAGDAILFGGADGKLIRRPLAAGGASACSSTGWAELLTPWAVSVGADTVSASPASMVTAPVTPSQIDVTVDGVNGC